MDLPSPIAELADDLIGSAGAEAVTLGGSRALGLADGDSDWDLGLWYRDRVDLGPLARWGEVNEPGSWGRLMNGGAWLDLDGTRVDVLLRDLDALERWAGEAALGRFEIDHLPGYGAGIPTYSLVADAALSEVVRGRLDLDTDYPEALAEAGRRRWRLNRDFSRYHARRHRQRGSTTAALAQLARAVLEESHARCCEQGRWVLNEKHVLATAGIPEPFADSGLALEQVFASLETSFPLEP